MARAEFAEVGKAQSPEPYWLTGEMGLDLQGSGEPWEHPECLAGCLAPRATQDKLDPIGGESGAAPLPTQRPLPQFQP